MLETKSSISIKILKKYPMLCAHLICESIGYLTPKAAALMLDAFINGKPFYCEWTYDIYLKRKKMDRTNDESMDVSLIEITKDIVKSAIKYRHGHCVSMANIKDAIVIIEKQLKGQNIDLASWF